MKKVHLTREQRYTISALHKQGCTQKMIAEAIHTLPSQIETSKATCGRKNQH